MDLRNQQIKETYGNLATINTVAGTPTTGVLQNGAGSNVTAMTLEGSLTAQQLNADNLRLDGNTISSTDTNGNIIIEANGTGSVIINEGGGDSDFRVEANGVVNALFVDGANGNVGIGTASPAGYSASYKSLIIDGGANPSMLQLNNTTTGSGANTGGLALIQSGVNSFLANPQAGYLGLFTNNLERMRIDSSGRVGIGVTPSATTTSRKAVQASNNVLWGATDGVGLDSNAYFNGSNDKYIADGYATSYYQSAGNHIWRVAGSGSAGGNISFSEKARIDSDGLKFNGDTAAANALDDYEQGTFTPTVYGGTTAGTTTYVTQNGTYTKIGRLVNVTLKVEYSAATGTGTMLIGGLPVAITQGGYEALGSVMSSDLNWTGGTMLTSYISSGSNALYIFGSSDDGVLTTQGVVNEAAAIWVSITYFAA